MPFWHRRDYPVVAFVFSIDFCKRTTTVKRITGRDVIPQLRYSLSLSWCLGICIKAAKCLPDTGETTRLWHSFSIGFSKCSTAAKCLSDTGETTRLWHSFF